MRKSSATEVQTIITFGTTFIGDIESEGKVTVQGIVEGNIRAASLKIAGQVQGNVLVEGLLELTETARINGNICTRQLSMSDGGIFNGQCNIN